jgi:hypothetical protein
MLKRGTLSVALTLISGVTAAAQQAGGTLQPSPEHMKLGVFVGTWKDEAEMKPGPFGPGGKLSLTETCEWFTGGFQRSVPHRYNGFHGRSENTHRLDLRPR